MIDRGIPRKDYNIVDENGESIGTVTSGSLSPALNIGIGLGYIQKPHTKPESKVFIQIRNRTLQAEVVKLPFV